MYSVRTDIQFIPEGRAEHVVVYEHECPSAHTHTHMHALFFISTYDDQKGFIKLNMAITTYLIMHLS